MNRHRASQEYLVAEVESADPLRRIVLLHEGAARALRDATRHIEAREIESAHTAFVKAQHIVMHFLSSVPDEDDGDAAANLRGLFTYCYQQIAEANLRKDPDRARAALEVIATLGEGWAQLDAQRSHTAEPDAEPRLEAVEA